ELERFVEQFPSKTLVDFPITVENFFDLPVAYPPKIRHIPKGVSTDVYGQRSYFNSYYAMLITPSEMRDIDEKMHAVMRFSFEGNPFLVIGRTIAGDRLGGKDPHYSFTLNSSKIDFSIQIVQEILTHENQIQFSLMSPSIERETSLERFIA